MNKFTRIAVLCLVISFIFAPAVVVLAQEGTHHTTAESAAEAIEIASDTVSSALKQMSLGHLGISLGAGLAAIGGGIGIGVLGAAVIDASARQPEMKGQLLTLMFIVAALVEGIALFSLVICMMCMFM